jgi:hypothetical protein
MSEYTRRVHRHYELTEMAQASLLHLAQLLSPGYWVLQISRVRDFKASRYEAVVHNGDDNVTGRGKTIAGALARLIAELLDGRVYPLGGNGGRYTREEDR